MILVTGGTGFLGAYIIKNLVEKGHAVRAIRRSTKTPFFIPQALWRKVAWVDGNVLDVVSLEEAIQDVTAVIHSAAVVSFSKKNRAQMYAVNIEGTANVVNAALEAGVQRFVHVSSIAAIGRTEKGEKVTEEKKWVESRSNTHYAITKHHAEMEVWRGIAEGLSGVIINPSTILGFGDWHQSSCAIFKNIYKEFPWYTEGINGFVGVEDVAEAVVQLLQSDISDRRFIVNGDNWVFQRLFNTIAEGFGKRKPYRKATLLLGELAWRLEKAKYLFTDGKPLLTKESARIAQSKTLFDSSALLTALPQFSFTPLEEVIYNACAAYKEALKNGTLAL
ncbi:MAG: NAD-dependent epimerase/dehydratase family protein [Flavisolibacter sp.]|nr:NAD-dependent epimerase/dehydratase family protein [Flavisolibacter sp.]